MDKKIFSGFKNDKKRLIVIENTLDKLYDRLDAVPVVSGKVSASMSSFPYTESHITVQMNEPRECDKIRKRIREKEQIRDEIRNRISTVQEFIENMPDGTDKDIFEMVYLDDMTHKEVGEIVGLERSSVSKRIDKYCD